MTAIPCEFRRDVQTTGKSETAVCELLRRVIDDSDGRLSRVDRSACQYCFNEGKTDVSRTARVIGSAVLEAVWRDPKLGGGIEDPLAQRMIHLAELAIADVPQTAPPVANGDPAARRHSAAKVDRTVEIESGPVAAVDVILPIARFDDSADTRIEAWLSQRDVYPIVHLVMDEGNELEVPQRLAEHPDLRFHAVGAWSPAGQTPTRLASMDPVTAAMVAAHQIFAALETPFIALGCDGVHPASFHLAQATASMIRGGHEWYAAAMQTGNRRHASQWPDPLRWQRAVQPATAVIRRSLWADLNGIAPRLGDADVDFFDRAARQHRSAVLRESIVATASVDFSSDATSEPPPRVKSDRFADPFQLHCVGAGFRVENLRCDVVLPFRGQLEYVEQAVDSVLSQTGIDLTLHLIDDATPQEIDPWLRRFLSDDRVRVYRNRINLGQFISFNNVVPHVQSDWIATQDGDDVSLPHRLADAVRIGRLCNADLVAGASVLDGPDDMVVSQAHQCFSHGTGRRCYRFSFVPRPDYVTYFLENPTLIHRREFFVRMDGFADLAHPLRNRTSIDSDYMLRALYAQANIVVTRRLAVVYRVHEDSAIQRPETRMGSPIRNWAQDELQRRVGLLRRGGIDPRTFGALGRHSELTQRWKG